MSFNETFFIKEVIKDYIKSNNNDYSIIYDNHYNNLIKTSDIKDIFQLYLGEIDLEDSKYRYGNNYIEIKTVNDKNFLLVNDRDIYRSHDAFHYTINVRLHEHMRHTSYEEFYKYY